MPQDESNATATIAVAGATGKLGGRVARRLETAGTRQLLLVRDRDRAPQLTNAAVAVTDYSPTAIATLTGVRTLLMVSAAETPNRVQQHPRLR